MSSIAEAIALASPSFTGQLLRPTDHGYDDVRRVHNGLVDKHPAIVARCQGVADVVDAVRLARTLDLEVSVRGGGHNVAGRAAIDHGLTIDLSPMKGIHVDPRTRTVRAQGGASYLAATRYVTYLEDDAPNPASVAYGPNLPRLRAIKTKYDLENFFRHNVNILPN